MIDFIQHLLSFLPHIDFSNPSFALLPFIPFIPATISAGSTIVASDFVATSSGAGDSGKVPILNSVGKILEGFLYNPNTILLTAGQAITAGQAVSIASGTDSRLITQNTQSQVVNIDGVTDYYGQTFLTDLGTTVIKSVKLYMAKVGSPTGTLTAALRATSGGLPTGANLATATLNVATLAAGLAEIEFVFTYTGAAENTTYAIVLLPNALTLDGSNYVTVAQQSSSVYANGTNLSSSDGTSWSAGSEDAYFIVLQYTGLVGEAILSCAALNDGFANAFIGFATNTVAQGGTVRVNVGGYNENQSGLTVGSIYYLSDTRGAISTSAGSQSRKIGVAIATTRILIRHENP